jgi:hypothetical protein
MRTAETLRNEAITRALDAACASRSSNIARASEPLYQALALASGLPGPRANLTLAQAFATDCALRGEAVDRVLLEMATLDAEAAPGASGREFLPLCAVVALGARAANEAALRERVLAIFHDAAEDVRFRVREAVPLALARLGAAMGHELAAHVVEHGWMDGYFQATAVLLALGDRLWLSTFETPDAPLDLLERAFVLARDAPRSAARYPGRKALIEALEKAPAAVGARFGRATFDRLVQWSDTKHPEMRAVIEKNLADKRLSVHRQAVASVDRALEASKKPPRDPTRIIQGMRGRGKKRGR